VTILCRTLKVSTSGYYAWRHREESNHAKRDRRLKVLVKEAHVNSRRTYGSPRVHEELKAKGEKVSRKRVIRLMQEQELQARQRKRYKHTTDSDHDDPIAPNLLDRQFTAEAPNQRWVGDTTELVIGGSAKLYLAAIVDLFARYVVGWALSAVNDRHLCARALEMAIKRRCPEAGLLHHSDRGCTYTSEDYQKLLAAHGIVCSMSGKGDCYDNAAMESWFSTFKSELGEHFATYAEAKEQAFDYIEVFYNGQRRHSSLGYLSPVEFERRARDADEPALELAA
jgi:putative transposase